MGAESAGNCEKSPVDRGDYEGLQIDTRARENIDKHLDSSKAQGLLDDDFDPRENYLNEKQTRVHQSSLSKKGLTGREGLASPDTAYTDYFSPTTSGLGKAGLDSESKIAPKAPQRRICGLNRRHFWEFLGLILAFATAGAVIGGVVGVMHARNNQAIPATPAAPPHPENQTIVPVFVPPKSADVMEGSPLNVISYDQGGNGTAEDRQIYRVYYQSLLGNIEEALYNGTTGWQAAAPILTDAMNHTGIATVTYLNTAYPNGSAQQSSMFYVGVNGFVQEKRMTYANLTSAWGPANLNSLVLPAIGKMSVPLGNDDPVNAWDSYSMAAVYCKDFYSGPGIRLFYHAQLGNGTLYVQEMVWRQDSDTWKKGAEIIGPWPNSRLAATIDESAEILRLFYSSGSQTLQESYIALNDSTGEYRNGLHVRGYLEHDDSDLAVLSHNGTTYCYHYASNAQTAIAGIHELTITGIPGSVHYQESYSLSEPLVVAPALTSNGNQSSYSPLAVSRSTASGLPEYLTVLWADQITGDMSTNLTGYGNLSQVSRGMSSSTWPTGVEAHVPLGSNDALPHA